MKQAIFTILLIFALVGLASAEQVCTESEYKGRTIQKCRDTGSPGGGSFSDSFTDPRDGQTYRTVQIGNQTWMAENLNYAYLQATSSEDSSSFCYKNSADSCAKYGRLYTWEAALDACPSGWHLPSMAEFETLITAVGGKGVAGTALKSNSGWNAYNGQSGNGTDAYGFSALPAGSRDLDGYFGLAGYYADFWSTTEYYSGYAYSMDYFTRYLDKNLGLSVRCLRDSRL